MLAELVRTDRLRGDRTTSASKRRRPSCWPSSSRSSQLGNVLIVVEAHRREAVPGRAQPAARRSDRGVAPQPAVARGYDKVLITVGAVKMIEERLQ